MEKGLRYLVALVLASNLFLGVMAVRAFSQSRKPFPNVIFAAGPNVLKFFEQGTGKVFIYSEENGKLIAQWQIDDLGGDLKKIAPPAEDIQF